MQAERLIQFLDLEPRRAEEADAIVLPVPFEKTVSYGKGTAGAPRAILEASTQVETFDEETLLDFEQWPRLHTAEPMAVDGDTEAFLEAAAARIAGYRGRFVLGLGGEHTVTYPLALGLAEAPEELTIVQIDAHADLADSLGGLRWSHGTVMRRLWERGCRVIQVGIRSLSREEYELAEREERIETYFAHRLGGQWGQLIARLGALSGQVYLTIDADGLDPSVIPFTGTPQPGGLSWAQAMELVRTVAAAPGCRLVGADVVEYVPSPHPPGADIVAARLAVKVLAYWGWASAARERA